MSLADVEFEVLRRTIAVRGTARIILFPAVIAAWAALVMTALALMLPAVASLLSLAILFAGFEAIHALHVGVERIGRYIQVNYEDPGREPRWETLAMALAPGLPGAGVDPLFALGFCLATVINVFPALLPPRAAAELVVIGLFHLTFLGRIQRARAAATRQRARDLESFRAIRDRSMAAPS